VLKVVAGPAASLAVTAPAGVTAGMRFGFSVRARDAWNNTATGYRGTVAFSSSGSISGGAVTAGGGGRAGGGEPRSRREQA